MKPIRIRTLAAAVTLAAVLAVPSAFAQNFSTDARRIGMGGTGDAQNVASRLVEEQQPYWHIGVPLGLIQLLQRRDIFNPDHAEFDPVRMMEYAASPLHLTVGRDSGSAGNRFVKNLLDAGVSRDLNAYRGFAPSPEIDAAGLAAPSWGKTFRFAEDSLDGGFHGVFIGAGPYIALETHSRFDQKLIDLLGSDTDVYLPNDAFFIDDDSTVQGAVAITGGYRGRLPFLPGFPSGSANEGLYLAVDYHHLHGVRYESADLHLQFDTDDEGLITLQPATTPITVNRATSTSGRGFAVDVATAFITQRWDLSFGVDGIGNRIDWKDLRGREYVQESLFDGGGFVDRPLPSPGASRRVTLPLRVSGSGGYRSDRWSAAADAADTLQGFRFNAGGEYRLGPLALRGGGRLARDRWHGATGIGLNIIPRFGIDVAAFQTSTNIEQKRRISFALSLRFNRAQPD